MLKTLPRGFIPLLMILENRRRAFVKSTILKMGAARHFAFGEMTPHLPIVVKYDIIGGDAENSPA